MNDNDKEKSMNNFIKYALIRAIKTVCQAAIGLIPASAVISEVDWRLVAGIVSILTSIATGLPEADYDEYINMDVAEPDDAEIFEDDDEDDDVELIMFDEELDDAEVFEDEDEE